MRRRAFCGLALGELALRPAPARPAPGGFASWADAYLRQGRLMAWSRQPAERWLGWRGKKGTVSAKVTARDA